MALSCSALHHVLHLSLSEALCSRASPTQPPHSASRMLPHSHPPAVSLGAAAPLTVPAAGPRPPPPHSPTPAPRTGRQAERSPALPLLGPRGGPGGEVGRPAGTWMGSSGLPSHARQGHGPWCREHLVPWQVEYPERHALGHATFSFRFRRRLLSFLICLVRAVCLVIATQESLLPSEPRPQNALIKPLHRSLEPQQATLPGPRSTL